uniref:Uncharacterized protein n=1 Tax=Siphoviridae sp. ctHEr2 TaxID=2826229 RepID=A0A8S5NFI9_9CAUD|nr:MAG TPA: hypothetical protein [Siphoviridae sp. ctHEr2]
MGDGRDPLHPVRRRRDLGRGVINMREIGTIGLCVHVRWPEALNFNEVLERLINEAPKLLQGCPVWWETSWNSTPGEDGEHWILMFRGEDGEPVVLERGKGVMIQFGHASTIKRIDWRGDGVLLVGEVYRAIGWAYDITRAEGLYDSGHPSMSELREKYLPIYDKITNN